MTKMKGEIGERRLSHWCKSTMALGSSAQGGKRGCAPLRFKGISPIISTVILIVLVFAIATAIIPWALNLVTTTTTQTDTSTEIQLKCQNTAYDFDTSYGTSGISWNLTSSPASLSTKITNKGTQNLWNFSFEMEIDNATSVYIKRYNATIASQKTPNSPLKPGESAILSADISESLTGVLKSLKVLNIVCPSLYAKQTL